jgi:DNA-binding CsgD family transcriptional regulator
MESAKRIVIKLSARRRINAVFAILLACLMAIALGSGQRATLAKRGQIELGDLSREVTELSGEWEFYWGRLLSPADFERSPGLAPDAYLASPSPWTKLRLDGRKLPNLGYATLRLTVRHGWKGREVGIKVKKINTAFALYADESPIAGAGSVSADATAFRARYKPQSAYFVPRSETTTLTLQVSNLSVDALGGGPVDEILIGAREAVENATNGLLISDALNIGGRSVIVLVFLGAFVLRKKAFALFFSLYNFILLLRISEIREVLFLRLFPFIEIDLFVRIFLASSFLTGPLLLFTIWAFLRTREARSADPPRRRWTLASLKGGSAGERIVLAIAVSCVLETLFFAVANRSAYLPSYRLFLPVLLASLIYPFVLIAGHTKRHNEYHGMLGIYALNFFVTVVEMLNQLRIVNQDYLLPLFFLRDIPALSRLSGLRVQQQFLSYLTLICFSFYFLRHYMTSLAHRPPANASAPASPPATTPMRETEGILREYGITDREREILAMAIDGLPYEEIAAKSFISKNTVKFHLRNIYRKLGVKNKIELAKKLSTPG